MERATVSQDASTPPVRSRHPDGVALESLMQQVAGDHAGVEDLVSTVPTRSGWLTEGRRLGMTVVPVGAARCEYGESHLWPAVVALVTRRVVRGRRPVGVQTRAVLLFVGPTSRTWQIIVRDDATVNEAQIYHDVRPSETPTMTADTRPSREITQ